MLYRTYELIIIGKKHLNVTRILIFYRLNKKAELLFEGAMTANNENDEEVVYIYLMKYCQILQVMKKTFTNDKDYINLMYKDNLKKAIKMLTHLKESLEKR